MINIKNSSQLTLPGGAIDAESLINSLFDAVILVDSENVICFVNHAAEKLLGISASLLTGLELKVLIPLDSPLFSIIEQCRRSNSSVVESDVHLESPKIGSHDIDVRATIYMEGSDYIVLMLQTHLISRQMGKNITNRGSVRSVTAMASMLAHEVKNPLSGIRGAAQLLEDEVSQESLGLTKLICDETDRIVLLLDRMSFFSDTQPPERDHINIHEVLNHVCQLVHNGFGRHVNIIEEYDPSLPNIHANRDQLVQVFLNLLKNATEAVPNNGGQIELMTRYRHGTRISVSSSNEYIDLPMEIIIRDNGDGVPDDLKTCLFDPFVTTKQNGSGLGLALVAKIIDAHGGVVELVTKNRKTEFRVLLPINHTLLMNKS
ncbi:MAG: ATP-binding protein [Alphaproteobacteria bacterium]|nr:ATP-binding protein [Alphaproteobacteria bacterium]